MRLTDLYRTALVCLAASAPSAAFAVQCGDTLNADTRLQSDLFAADTRMHCGSLHLA